MKDHPAFGWIVASVIIFGFGYLVTRDRFVNRPEVKKVLVAQTQSSSTIHVALKPPEEITIGFVGPLTGNMSAMTRAIQQALVVAVQEINDAGGVIGKMLRLVSEDGACDARMGARAAQQLIDVHHAVAIIGGVCSSETLGMAPIANEQRVVVVSPSATLPDITTEGGPYLFRIAPSDARAARAAAVYALTDLSAKTAVVIAEPTNGAQHLRRAFVTSFTSSSTTVVIDAFSPSSTFETAKLMRTIARTKPNVLFIAAQEPSSTRSLLRTLREQKMSTPILIGGMLWNDEDVKTHATLLEGAFSFDPALDVSSQAAQRFFQAYTAQTQEPPEHPLFQANAYSAVYLLKDAIERAGESGERMRPVLAQLAHWNGGALENVSLDIHGDPLWQTYVVMQVIDGQRKVLRRITLTE